MEAQAPHWQPVPQPPPVASEAPPPAAPAPTGRWILVGLLGFLAFVVVTSLGFGVLWLLLRPGPVPPGDVVVAPPDDPPLPDPDDAVVPTGATTAPVEVTAAEPTIQWMELSADGERLRERGSLVGGLPPGDYVLAVKVVGREPVSAEVAVGEGGLRLSCSPAPEGRVSCAREGGAPLVLKP